VHALILLFERPIQVGDSIEIAFPQQDLHIRTIPDAWSPGGAPRSRGGSAAGLGTVVQE
jgi:small-conductance mechanosensitive channel